MESPIALTGDAFDHVMNILAKRGHKRTLLHLGSANRELFLLSVPHLYRSFDMDVFLFSWAIPGTEQKILASMLESDALGAGRFGHVREILSLGLPLHRLCDAHAPLLERCPHVSNLQLKIGRGIDKDSSVQLQQDRVARAFAVVASLPDLVELEIQFGPSICQFIRLPSGLQVLRLKFANVYQTKAKDYIPMLETIANAGPELREFHIKSNFFRHLELEKHPRVASLVRSLSCDVDCADLIPACLQSVDLYLTGPWIDDADWESSINDAKDGYRAVLDYPVERLVLDVEWDAMVLIGEMGIPPSVKYLEIHIKSYFESRTYISEAAKSVRQAFTSSRNLKTFVVEGERGKCADWWERMWNESRVATKN